LLAVLFSFLFLLLLCDAAENPQMAEIRREYEKKLSSLSIEGQLAAKEMMEVLDGRLSREETRSRMEEMMEKLSEKIKKELKTLRPIRNGKVITMEQIFEFIEKI
ncbi:hypothetical protein PMAYCL1PPCAC_02084, partial [Pristionchus mayeri]